jgi:hypothetical protein
MKIHLLPALLLLSACADKSETEPDTDTDTDTDTDPDPDPDPEEHTWQTDSSLCGQIILEDSCSMPSEITVYTVKEGSYACNEGFGDTGGNWDDWRDEEIATVSIDADGYFEAAIPPGDYAASTNESCYGCESFTVSEGDCTELDIEVYEPIMVDAPNIYLYPEQPTATRVRIANPTELTITDPPYNPETGWWTIAMPDGQLLTKTGWKDFLFYELAMDGRRFQREEGWCATGKRAQLSIENAMSLYGFNSAEIGDFSEFWDSEFPDTHRYTIYPQTERLRKLDITPAPDAFLRVWFLVEDGCNKEATQPEIPAFEPKGYTATEWGVMFSGGLKGPEVIVTGL